MWRYKVDNRADSHQALHIQVTSLPSTNNDVSVRVWTNQELAEDESQEDVPVIIYAEIKVRLNQVFIVNLSMEMAAVCPCGRRVALVE